MFQNRLACAMGLLLLPLALPLTSLGQSNPQCSFTVSPASVVIPSGGGTGTFSVTPSDASCSWNVFNGTLGPVSVNILSGTGPGEVTYTVQGVNENNTTAEQQFILVGNVPQNQFEPYFLAGTTGNPSALGIVTIFRSGQTASSLKVTTTQLNIVQGQIYSATLTATGGTPPYTWQTPGDNGPYNGVHLSPTGVLSSNGIPVEFSTIPQNQLPQLSIFTPGVSDSAGNSVIAQIPAFLLATPPCPTPNVILLSGIPEAKSVLGIYISAQFTPQNSQTINNYAQSCGFQYIDWQQQITSFPPISKPAPKSPNLVTSNVNPPVCWGLEPVSLTSTGDPGGAEWKADKCTLFATPELPLYDPPPGDWNYDQTVLSNTFPFYYNRDNINVTTNTCTSVTDSTLCPTFPFVLSEDQRTFSFVDSAGNPILPGDAPSSTPTPGHFIAFETTLIGFSEQNTTNNPKTQLCADGSGYCTPLYQWTWNTTFDADLNLCPLACHGGISITSINGVQLPSAIPPADFVINSPQSGLAYSRVSGTFDGSFILTNVSTNVINGPLQIFFFGMPTDVTLANATGTLSGTPYFTLPGPPSLAPGQAISFPVQFKNLLDENYKYLTPKLYAGSIN